MATGSGLDAQTGFVSETTYGTAVTVTRFLEFMNDGLKMERTWLEPQGLRSGSTYQRLSRVSVSRYSVSGDTEFEVVSKGMGLLVKHMLGSAVTTTTLISGSAYKQVHVPAGFRGKSMTVQVGRPEPGTGTVRPFTYSGVKITGWEFSLADGETPKLKLTFDGRDEATVTALATPAYLSGAATFTFRQAILKLGGTATTTAGETTIASGAVPSTVIKSISISGSNPMATERYGLGNAGLKNEPLENDFPSITGSLAAEFNSTDYATFAAQTATPLQLDLVGAVLGATNYTFSIILPAILIKNASPTVTGPDIVQMSSDFQAYYDETTNPTIQIKIISDEASAI